MLWSKHMHHRRSIRRKSYLQLDNLPCHIKTQSLKSKVLFWLIDIIIQCFPLSFRINACFQVYECIWCVFSNHMSVLQMSAPIRTFISLGIISEKPIKPEYDISCHRRNSKYSGITMEAKLMCFALRLTQVIVHHFPLHLSQFQAPLS